MVTQVRAVVFDVGGVLMVPDPDLIRAAIGAAGFTTTADDEAVRRAHHAAVLSEPEGATWPDRRANYAEVVAARLCNSTDGALRTALDELLANGSARLWSRPIPDGLAALSVLAEAAIPIAVVSNADGTVEAQLSAEGIAQVGPGDGVELAAMVDSGALGFSKPDPRVFAPVLARLADIGIDPGACLYVGDTPAIDGAGAVAAGMQPLIVDPFADAPVGLVYPTTPSAETTAQALAAGAFGSL